MFSIDPFFSVGGNAAASSNVRTTKKSEQRASGHVVRTSPDRELYSRLLRTFDGDCDDESEPPVFV